MRTVVVAAGVVLLAVTGCASTTRTTFSATPESTTPMSSVSSVSSTPSTSVVSSTTVGPRAVSACGTVPVSTRLWAKRLRLTVTGPRTTRPAAMVHPKVMLSAVGRKYLVSASLPVHTYIVRGRAIVGYFTGYAAGGGYGNVITGRPVPLEAAVVAVRGCPDVEDSTSLMDRPPLPPGRYALVVCLRGGGPNESQLVVSKPFPITVVR